MTDSGLYSLTFFQLMRGSGLTPRWSQRALPLEFVDDSVFILVFEFRKLAHDARGSALDR